MPIAPTIAGDESLPDPLTPPECDLRDFPFMPIDISRLFGSRFHANANDTEWRAGVTLWLKSFHQVPCGSIPDDDVALCRLAELGRDIKSWKKVKLVAMHGWIKCSDGRWYHPVVCEKAIEGWTRKLFQRERSKKANEARWGASRGDAKRNPPSKKKETKKDDTNPPASIPEGIEVGLQNHPKGQGQGQREGKKESPSGIARRRSRSPIPPDWQPNDAGVAYAKARGVNRGEIQKFINHHTAHGKLMADWNAAWRTWCDNAAKFGGIGGPLFRPPDGPTPMVGGLG